MGRKKGTGKLAATMREVAHQEKTGKVIATVQEITYYNMCLTEAILELLAERGVVTGSEVMERMKKVRSETEFQSILLQ